LIDNPRALLLDGEQRWSAEEIHERVEELLASR